MFSLTEKAENPNTNINKELTVSVSIIVPSLNPDEKLLAVVSGLIKAGFQRIILVDDGSKQKNKHYFNTAVTENRQCVLLRHNKNLGKGRALKTALNYFLNNQNNDIGVITVDGDNQHKIEDVLACAEALEQNPESLVLGCRDFSLPDVPPRNAFGNKVTAWCFKALCGIAVTDTQTGLRGISAAFAYEILDLSGERFEYETNMLMQAKRLDIAILEVPISTVYINDNATSHFNPLRDSFSIYHQILKFLWSGIASVGCDYSLFLLLNRLFAGQILRHRLLIATAGARLCSSVLNYLLNKNYVFGSKTPVKTTMVKYYILCILQMMASYGAVFLFTSVFYVPAAVSKLIADSILFFISFKIQRELIFNKTNKEQSF